MLFVSETIAQSQQTDTSKMNIIILMKSENFAGCLIERAKVILQRSLSHDRGLTQTRKRSWIKVFAMIISAWWLQTSKQVANLFWEKVKIKRKTLKMFNS